MPSFFRQFGIAHNRRSFVRAMTSEKETIEYLENQPRALNERLMNSKTVADANNTERELWALREAIRHQKRALNQSAAKKTETSLSSSGT
jgi:hypothetical protein